MKYLPTFLLLGATLGDAARAQSVPDNNRVVPGQRIGRVFLGDSRVAVRRRLGKPTSTFALAGGLSSELWKAPQPDENGRRHKLEVLYRRGVAVQIETTNPIFQSKSGLSIDDDPKTWSNNLGKPIYSTYYYPNRAKKPQAYHDWKRAGLTLETTGDGEEEENVTLIVHRRGIAVVPDAGGVEEH